ncbi:MAG: PAS domain-containing protein [Hyphomonadaceae bacterium]
MTDRLRITAGEFIRNVGRWQSEALERPIAITYHGHERLVLVSSARFSAMDAPASDRDADRRHGDPMEVGSRLSDGWILFDQTLAIVAHNAAAAALLGHASESLAARRADECLPSAHGRTFQQYLKRTAHSGADSSFRLDLPGPDGETYFPRDVVLFKSAHGVQALIHDRGDEALLNHLKGIVEAADKLWDRGAGLVKFVLDVRGRIIQDAERLAPLIGFTSADLQGAHLADLVRPEERRLIAKAIAESLDSGAVQRLRAHLMHKSGEDVAVDAGIVSVQSLPVADSVLVLLQTRLAAVEKPPGRRRA